MFFFESQKLSPLYQKAVKTYLPYGRYTCERNRIPHQTVHHANYPMFSQQPRYFCGRKSVRNRTDIRRGT